MNDIVGGIGGGCYACVCTLVVPALKHCTWLSAADHELECVYLARVPYKVPRGGGFINRNPRLNADLSFTCLLRRTCSYRGHVQIYRIPDGMVDSGAHAHNSFLLRISQP